MFFMILWEQDEENWSLILAPEHPWTKVWADQKQAEKKYNLKN